MTFLAQRTHQAEFMDDPNVGFLEFQQTVGQIESINKKIGSYRPTFKVIKQLLQRSSHSNEPVRILDIGFGNGDFLRRIHSWAKQQNIAVTLAGVDLNPWSKQAAELITPHDMQIEYFTCNIFDFNPQRPFDIIINSLFTHHLTDVEIINVMQWMSANAKLGWFINDLHRHPVAYYFIYYFVRLLRYNRLVKNDAPLSVARAFTHKDWQQLVSQSKLNPHQIQIKWYWPFRYGVTYVA